MNLPEPEVYSPLRRLEEVHSVTPFAERLKEAKLFPLLSAPAIKTMQMNIGKVCNLMCKHCHVEAGPQRTESMSREIMAQCLQVAADEKIKTLDITGGSPELNSHLPWLIKEASRLGCHIMLRTNLTLLDSKQYAHFPELFATHHVELVSSLPYYTEKTTDRQRGNGVYQTSIKVLTQLNELGYGQENGRLILNLVYNPSGAFLPAPQKAIEADYRRVLLKEHGIRFNGLFNITNLPVGRFLTFLYDSGNLESYMKRLADSFNPATVSGLMCREQISVGWDGQLYDCDFNQMLGLNCHPGHIAEFDRAAFREREIRLANHCYGCTAGSGSSCGGAVV